MFFRGRQISIIVLVLEFDMENLFIVKEYLDLFEIK